MRASYPRGTDRKLVSFPPDFIQHNTVSTHAHEDQVTTTYSVKGVNIGDQIAANFLNNKAAM